MSLWGVVAVPLTTVIQASPRQDSLPGGGFRVGRLAAIRAHREDPSGGKNPGKGTAGTWGPTGPGCVLLPHGRQWCWGRQRAQARAPSRSTRIFHVAAEREWAQQGEIEECPGAEAVELRLDGDGSLSCWLKERSDKLS